MMGMGTTESMSSWLRPYSVFIAGSFLTTSSEIQSSGASDGTEVTSPVPTSGLQNLAGNTGMSLWIMGAVHIHPIMSFPGTFPTTSMSSFWYPSFFAASGDTIHVSPAWVTLTYSTSGFTQKQT